MLELFREKTKRRLFMKLMLVAINAKYIHSNLAVHSLRAFANMKGAGASVSLAEYTINHSEEDILGGIYMERADVIAFSCYIWNIGIVLRLTKELRKIRPDVKLWLGGPEVSYDAVECMKKNPELDGIMIGEGELTFLELVKHFNGEGQALEYIEGIAYREGSSVRVTGPRKPLSLDEIPFPYEELEDFKNRIIYYESSRGCPFSCSYCLSSVDKRIRFRNTKKVTEELQYLMDRQVPQVKFVDRTFNCNRKHAMEIWQYIKEHDNGITNFHFEIAADLLEEDEIEFLAALRPGQVQFEIGVQSTNPDTVEAIHRKMDLDRLKSNVEQIKAGKNIHQHLDLIAGLPMEDYQSFEQSFREVYEMEPDQLQLGFLKVLKGSPIEEECRTYGIVYRDNPPYEVLFTKHLSYEEMLWLKGICEMVEIYYNSGQFTNAIRYLKHFYSSPMKLYEELYRHYEMSHILLQAHSRIKRYEILLDFFKEHVLSGIADTNEQKQEGVEVFEEILLMDLFLREDLKSRPGFATKRTQKNYKELYEEYRRKHMLIHIEDFTYDIEATLAIGKAVRRDTTILFNYSERDPITRSARITIL
jgi:radical SAM superfamily enzyme YgiQ (UPF0313 family)